MKALSLSVVIPAYNEEDNIQNTIIELDTFLKTLNCKDEIITVDDGSTDLTPKIVNSLIKDIPNLTLVSHSRNLGIGAALKTGFEKARYDLVTMLPADGQIPPYELKKFLDNFNDCDMLTSTYEDRRGSFWRYILSRGWRILLKLVLNYNLESHGPYVFKRELLKQVALYSKTGLMNIEFPNKIKKAGFRIKNITVICQPRRSGKSKILNLRSIISILKEIFKLKFQNNRKRVY